MDREDLDGVGIAFHATTDQFVVVVHRREAGEDGQSLLWRAAATRSGGIHHLKNVQKVGDVPLALTARGDPLHDLAVGLNHSSQGGEPLGCHQRSPAIEHVLHPAEHLVGQ